MGYWGLLFMSDKKTQLEAFQKAMHKSEHKAVVKQTINQIKGVSK